MLLVVPARIDRIFPVSIVGVSAALAGATARKMLHHCIDAVLSPARLAVLRRLKTVTISPGHINRHLRVFPEGICKPHPSGLRRQIDLRRKRGGDSQRTVFRRGNLAKFFYQRRIEGRGKADAVRPFGNRLPGHAHVFRRGTCPVPRI